MGKAAVIIPIFGQEFYTDMVLEDIEREKDLVDVYLVDNKGDYVAPHWVTVLRPGANLRWTRGTNMGWGRAFLTARYSGYFLMNNDVRLSKNFFAEMMSVEGVDMLGCMYNDVWPQHHCSYRGSANEFEPQDILRDAPFLDGTCMYITDKMTGIVGFLDEKHFGETGWGGAEDYALRVRNNGGRVAVTGRAYLEHFHQGTAKTISDDWNGIASIELNGGMEAKYGSNWREILGGYQ